MEIRFWYIDINVSQCCRTTREKETNPFVLRLQLRRGGVVCGLTELPSSSRVPVVMQ
jgi:hypothetical protein